jgi:hypothetical protein
LALKKRSVVGASTPQAHSRFSGDRPSAEVPNHSMLSREHVSVAIMCGREAATALRTAEGVRALHVVTKKVRRTSLYVLRK